MAATVANLIELAILRRSLPDPLMRRAIRQAAGISQAKLGAALGVSRQAVAHWESGEREPSDDVLDRYANALTQLAQLAQLERVAG